MIDVAHLRRDLRAGQLSRRACLRLLAAHEIIDALLDPGLLEEVKASRRP
jgi:hypothetical protein